MGSGGSGSGLTAGKRANFVMPDFNKGSEKQQAWAGRILKGYDEAFDRAIERAKEKWQEEAYAYTGEDAKRWANKRDNAIAAIREAQDFYRNAVATNDQYRDAKLVIESRDDYPYELQKMTYQFFVKHGITDWNNVSDYIHFRVSR